MCCGHTGPRWWSLHRSPDPRVELREGEEGDRKKLKRGEEIEGEGRDGENF